MIGNSGIVHFGVYIPRSLCLNMRVVTVIFLLVLFSFSTRSSTDRNHPYHVLRETGSFSSVVNLTNRCRLSALLVVCFAFAYVWIFTLVLLVLAFLGSHSPFLLQVVCLSFLVLPFSCVYVTHTGISTGWILGYMLILGSAVVTIFSLHLLSLCATKVEHPSSFYKVC